MKPTASLSLKQFFFVLALGAALTAVAVALQYSRGYQREREQVNAVFDAVEESYLPALALSVFEFDLNQTDLLLEGIVLLRDISYAEVRERRGDEMIVLAQAGSRVEKSALVRSFPLIHIHQGDARQLGNLTVQADLRAVEERVSDRLGSFVITSAAQVFTVALLVLLVVQVTIVRHLRATARFVSRIDAGPAEEGQLELDHLAGRFHMADEIDDIVSAINSMNSRLSEAFAQRETLLRELYHRTKNNMQVIASMLSVQAAGFPENEDIRRLVTDTQNRIYAMSLVHEKLYQSRDLSRVALKEYLSQLALHIRASYGDRAGPRLELRLEEHQVLLDLAIPCGLIVNELVSNSMKHAFPEGRARDGVIVVSLETTTEGALRLHVSDNGVGFPEGFDPRTEGGMGLQSVVALATHQLGGSISFDGIEGASCTVEFEPTQYSERV